MFVSKINIEQPLKYMECGQFIGARNWKHPHFCRNGDYEVIIGIENALYLSIDGIPFEINPGDVCTIPPSIPFEGNRCANNTLSFYWLHFIPRANHRKCLPGDALREVSQAFSPAAPPSASDSLPYIYLPQLFHPKNPEKIYILMRQVLDVCNSRHYSSYCADYLTTALALEITEQYSMENLSSLREDNRLAPIMEWIRINICNDLTVLSVASHFSMNPDYLSRLFAKYLGMGTKQYINLQRINTVKGLLCTTDMTITEIAYTLNFKDEKYLMRLFKKVEGITISQYRKAYVNTYLNSDQIDKKWR